MRVLLDTTALYVEAELSDLAFTPEIQRCLSSRKRYAWSVQFLFNKTAIKANKELTPLTQAHIEKLILDLDPTVLPLIAEHSFKLFGLPPHHNDPFDRMLIATALAEDLSLVARDGELRCTKGFGSSGNAGPLIRRQKSPWN